MLGCVLGLSLKQIRPALIVVGLTCILGTSVRFLVRCWVPVRLLVRCLMRRLSVRSVVVVMTLVRCTDLFS